MMDKKYYGLLKEKFQNKENVVTEIINLEAILHLPKGTEHFLSDVHGEFAAFDHVLRNGSGSVKEKLVECFAEAANVDIDDLATLIYYPEEKISLALSGKTAEEKTNWYAENIQRLIQAVNFAGRKYTRSKVRKALPSHFSYIIEELLTEAQKEPGKEDYFHGIIDKIIDLQQASALIIDLCYLIQRFVVDHLHVVGDIYDRGPAPDFIIERLIEHHSVDVQWGNHDIVWIAAMAGSPIAMVNLLRICARYGNLDIVEDRYGISVRPLIEYSQKHYLPSEKFAPHVDDEQSLSDMERKNLNLVQQATAILQFKLEGQLIARRPEFDMKDRGMLAQINYQTKEIQLYNNHYPLTNFQAPTVDPSNPCALTTEEKELLEKLLVSFQASEKLRRHMDFLIEKGNMYLCYNGNLLLHGCIPLHENGDFKSFRLKKKQYSGKELLDLFEKQVRKSYQQPEISDDLATDLLWYLWTGECSSLFGKQAMTTFERYYIEDKATHKEEKNAYYRLRNEESICQEILQTFGLPVTGHIVNGHTPVQAKKGESPIKANGRLLVIDGGFAKSYQSQTGLAGYTLLSNSYGLQLVAHQSFSTVEDAVLQKTDILSTKRLIEAVEERIPVRQTNTGQKLLEEMEALEVLYQKYEKF